MSKLTEGLEAGVKEMLNGMIDGAAADLDGPVKIAAERLMAASLLAEQRPDLVAEVQDQLAVLWLERKWKLKSGAAGKASAILGVGLNALVSGAVAGLNSTRV